MQGDSLAHGQDTTATTAVPEAPFVTPANGQFMTAAYIIAGTIYLAYAISLIARARKERSSGG